MKQNDKLTEKTGKPAIKGALDPEDTKLPKVEGEPIVNHRGQPYLNGLHEGPEEGTNVEDEEGRPI